MECFHWIYKNRKISFSILPEYMGLLIDLHTTRDNPKDLIGYQFIGKRKKEKFIVSYEHRKQISE